MTRNRLLALLSVCAVTLLLGYANKARCTGPEFTAAGRSTPNYGTRKTREVCYSDIQQLWIGRDLAEHHVPYLSGGITDTGALYGGTVEYPVLTGMLAWLGALPADTDAGFLLFSAVLLAPFGLATAWMLGQLSGWRGLLWAAGPPLVFYAFHNWDLAVVACAVAAVWLVHGWRTDRALRDRAVPAAVALGLGFAFKLYPAAFVVPLAAYVLTGGHPGRGFDLAGALRVCGVAAGTAVLANLPFAVFGYQGWSASIAFQRMREADITSNSIWYWGFRPLADGEGFQDVVGWVSPLAVLASFALAVLLGWRRYRRAGTYPWIAVSGAMLCGFLLLHTVHSPQYALWLLPFFVLLRVHWGWIAAYLLADAAMGIGIFRWFYALDVGDGYAIYDGVAAQLVMIGVWGRAALLAGLFAAFLRAGTTLDGYSAADWPRARRAPSPPVPST